MDISALIRLKYLGKNVKQDDILDAAVLALTGLKALQNGTFVTLPECPPNDNEGLKMQMLWG